MRLFTGIDLPTDLIPSLHRLITVLRSEALIKWSPLDNLHITTKFIGELPEGRIDELDKALRALAPRQPFDIQVKELGWFPHERSPRVLWAGIDGGEALAQLAGDTETKLQTELGITKEDRPFSPHLTLARIKNPVPLMNLRNRVRELQAVHIGTFPVSGFVLYRSEPGTNASIYHKLREYKFESAMAAGTI